jgi:Na+/melibiose symporter-like transporter
MSEHAGQSPSPGGGPRRGIVWTYGALGFPLALLGYPLGIWLPRAYGTDVGVALPLVGLIMTAAAIFDAVTDPLIGFASDRVRSRWGRRKGWIGVGIPLLTLGIWMLLNPAAGSTAVYLGVWYIFLRVGSTMVLVPYGAWGAELSTDYHARTALNSARQRAVLIGLIAAAFIPAIVERSLGDDTRAVDVLAAFSWSVALALPLIGAALLWKVPEPAALPTEGRTSLMRSLVLMWRNGLFRRVLIIELVITGGEQFRNALSLFFMQDVIGIDRPGQLYVVYFVTGLLAMPVWDFIARRYGKHRSLACAMVLVSFVSISIFALEPGQVRAFQLLFAVKGFCFGAFAYLPLAMLADVVDIDTLRSGEARTGSYFAVHGFMTKCAASFGGLSLPLLALAGFDAAPDAVNGEFALLWLGILYAIVPTVLFVFAFWLCWTWPLTAERHARMRGMLERKAERLARVAGAPEGTATVVPGAVDPSVTRSV